jgi:hypothetical protein
LHRAEAPPEGYGVTSIHLRDATLEMGCKGNSGPGNLTS